jgi:outer membrane protein TolC
MSLKRWAARLLIGALATPAFGIGCKQQLFLEPGDYKDAVQAGLPPALERNVHSAILPPTVDQNVEPATVNDPKRPPRYITLKECVAVALEQGSDGGTGVNNLGGKNDNLPANGQVSLGQGSDAVRAFALVPAKDGSNIERALSKFDARWITSMQWTKNDNPVAAQFVSFQSQNDQANFSSTLAKAMPTGGVAGITIGMSYAKFSNIPASQQANFVSPNYTPSIQLAFEQPLLQMFGVEVNQLSSRLVQPLTIQGIGPTGGQSFFGANGNVEGILLTRIRYDQSRIEFERRINLVLVNVESAYWNLYSSYYTLYAAEEGLRLAMKNWIFIKNQVAAGIAAPQLEYQALAQVEQFRGDVVRARGGVLESERALRGFMGMRSDDDCRLVPMDRPNLAEFQPDYYEAANETIIHRPELMLARQEVKAVQFNLALLRNVRQPDLRFFSSYNIQGIGTRLDGSELVGATNTLPGNAFSSLANNQFNSWTLGLRLEMPLGFRDANALVRQGSLDLTRTYYQLRDSELKALEYLTSRYRRVVETYRLIPHTKARRHWQQLYVEHLEIVIKNGRWNNQDFLNLNQAQRELADMIRIEYQSISEYNKALAEFEFAKGTILQYNNVTLAEGPLPPWVSKRAAQHERERTDHAIKLRERPNQPVITADGVGGHTIGPAVGSPFCKDLPGIQDIVIEGSDPLAPQPNGSGGYQPGVPGGMPMPMPNGTPGNTAPTPRPSPPMPNYPMPTNPNPMPVSVGTPGSLDVQSEGNVTIPPHRLPQRFTPVAPTNLAPPVGSAPSSSGANFPPPLPIPQPTGGTSIPATLPTSVPTISTVPNMR